MVGLVPGTAMHLWHGRTEDRGYETRPRILVRNKYDPRLDVRVRDDGLLELTDSKPMLRPDLLTYFASRHEDSVDTPETDRRRGCRLHEQASSTFITPLGRAVDPPRRRQRLRHDPCGVQPASTSAGSA
jgi:hypothetical protein